MSSAVLSPHTTALSLEKSSGQGASRVRPTPTHTIYNRVSSTSAVPTHSSATPSVAGGIRSRMSGSPDDNTADNRPNGVDHNDEIDGDGFEPTASQLRSSPDLRSEQEGEEGEEEIDIDAEPEEEGEEELTRPPSPEDDVEPPKETQRIKLVFGKKRKPDDDEAEEPVSVGTVGADTTDKASEEALRIVEKEQLKRMPRKKRKWLKKGEIDPDDHVAVARQRERHKLIDQALENLDFQYEEVEALRHESVIWMLEELERRKEHQLAKLEARYKAEVEELGHMRDHFKKQFRSDFRVRRDELTDTMSEEIRQKISRLKHQNTLLRVVPDTYPASRDGRGGGGWVVPTGHLLSSGEQNTVPIRAGSSRVRMDISVDVIGVASEIGRADLAKMTPVKHTPTPPPRPVARDKKPIIETQADVKPPPRPTARPAPVSAPAPAPSPAPALPASRVQTKPPTYSNKSAYAAAPASASYAYQPTAQPDRRPDPTNYTPPMPLYHGAAKGNPAYLSWEEYRSYAKYDAWGCPLPHDNYRRDLVLRESWEKKLGRIPRESVVLPPNDAAKKTHSGRGPTGPVTASHQPVTATAGPSTIRPQPATATATSFQTRPAAAAANPEIAWKSRLEIEAEQRERNRLAVESADRQRKAAAEQRLRVEEEQRRVIARRKAEDDAAREREAARVRREADAAAERERKNNYEIPPYKRTTGVMPSGAGPSG